MNPTTLPFSVASGLNLCRPATPAGARGSSMVRVELMLNSRVDLCVLPYRPNAFSVACWNIIVRFRVRALCHQEFNFQAHQGNAHEPGHTGLFQCTERL